MFQRIRETPAGTCGGITSSRAKRLRASSHRSRNATCLHRTWTHCEETMIAGLVLAQALSFHPMNMTADRLWGVYRIKSSGTQLVVRWLGSRKYEARGKLS